MYWITNKTRIALPDLTDRHIKNILEYMHREYLGMYRLWEFQQQYPEGSVYHCQTVFPARGQIAGYLELVKEALERGITVEHPPNPLTYSYDPKFEGWGKRLDRNKNNQLFEIYTRCSSRSRVYWVAKRLVGSSKVRLLCVYDPVSILESRRILAAYNVSLQSPEFSKTLSKLIKLSYSITNNYTVSYNEINRKRRGRKSRYSRISR
jgi:hypothetical protein